MKTDFIQIMVAGPKAVRQEVIDRVFELVLDEEFLEEMNMKKGAMIRIESTLAPSEELVGDRG